MGAIFDENGHVQDRDALRSVAGNIQPAGPVVQDRRIVEVDRAADTQTRELVDWDTGRIMGHSIEHGNGRVDANVTPEPVKAGAHLTGEK